MSISNLIEQTIAQHIIAPKVLSYAGTKLNEVKGRFISANRVYNFVLDKQGVSYSPAGQGDSLLFSGLYLERLDAARKPKVGNDKCNAGKSYQCGKICLGNRRKCHKGVRDVNDARRIASILESTNEKLKGSLEGSDKAIARGKALFEARGKRALKPKAERVKPDDTDALQKRKAELDKVKLKGEFGDVKIKTGNRNGEMGFRVKKGINYPNGLSINKTVNRLNQSAYSVTHSATGWSLFDFRTKKEAERFVKAATKDNVDFSKLDENGVPDAKPVVSVLGYITGRDITPLSKPPITEPQKNIPKETEQINVGGQAIKIDNPAQYRNLTIEYDPIWGWTPLDSKGKPLTYQNKRGGESSFTFASKKKAEAFTRDVTTELNKRYKKTNL